jgi:hypothetical protein
MQFQFDWFWVLGGHNVAQTLAALGPTDKGEDGEFAVWPDTCCGI